MIPETGKIYYGDCVEIMKGFPDLYFDLCLTDFPYGIGEEYESFNDSPENLKNLVDSAMPEILRVSKRALITCGLSHMNLYPKPTWVLCWLIPGATSTGPWGFIDWSPILAYGKCPFLSAGKGRRSTFINYNEIAEKNGHPCPKPLTFWKHLLNRGSIEKTDLILDPFMGSGTTAIASMHLERNFVGIELEKKYIDIAQQRIDAERAQGKLF